MRIHFWGVRGSIPSPITPDLVKEKIQQVLQMLTPRNVESDSAKAEFIKTLPEYLYGTVGGNTSCVEVTGNDGTKFIFDAGSGIRILAKNGTPPENMHYNIFFSHLHWDHVQGFPFFDFAYYPKAVFDIYSPYPEIEKYLRKQMDPPFYPVNFDVLSKNIHFHVISPSEPFKIGDMTISCVRMSHPGGSYSYLLEESGKKFVYATDVELNPNSLKKTDAVAKIFENADVLIIDSQYTLEEYSGKVGWGHSAFCYAMDFAAMWNVKNVYLFHHEPMYSDKKLYSILESARQHVANIANNSVNVHLATEGLEISLC